LGLSFGKSTYTNIGRKEESKVAESKKLKDQSRKLKDRKALDFKPSAFSFFI
jgi:hypothetical protein